MLSHAEVLRQGVAEAAQLWPERCSTGPVWSTGRWQDLTHWTSRASQVESGVSVCLILQHFVYLKIENCLRKCGWAWWLFLVLLDLCAGVRACCWCLTALNPDCFRKRHRDFMEACYCQVGLAWNGSWRLLLNLSLIRRCIRKVICSQELMSRPANCLRTVLAKLGMSKGKAMIEAKEDGRS